MNHVPLLDEIHFIVALSQHNINGMLYKTGSLHNRKVGFMRLKKKNLVFSGIDRKTLAKTEEECDALMKLSLDEGLAVSFLKESQSSGSSDSEEEEDAFHVLEEMNSKQQRRDSVQRLVKSRHDVHNSD